MTTTSLADAKARLSELVTSAEKTHERTVITKNGRPVAILMSIEDWEGVEETLDVMSDPDEYRAILDAIAEAHANPDDFITGDEMKALLEERRRLGGRPLTDEEGDAIVAAYRAKHGVPKFFPDQKVS